MRVNLLLLSLLACAGRRISGCSICKSGAGHGHSHLLVNQPCLDLQFIMLRRSWTATDGEISIITVFIFIEISRIQLLVDRVRRLLYLTSHPMLFLLSSWISRAVVIPHYPPYQASLLLEIYSPNRPGNIKSTGKMVVSDSALPVN